LTKFVAHSGWVRQSAMYVKARSYGTSKVTLCVECRIVGIGLTLHRSQTTPGHPERLGGLDPA
jgi:hypothetical protein